MKKLQDYIAPYIRIDDRPKGLAVGTVHGTAFFVNDQGTFLTARHVVVACEQDVAQNGGQPALLMRDDRHPKNHFRGAITNMDFAAAPYDVAVGTVDRRSKGYFVFGDEAKAWTWEDVYAAGYPATATRLEQGRGIIYPRGHKGQVLRQMSAGHVLINPHSAVIEVSFAITKGMSGAPPYDARPNRRRWQHAALFRAAGSMCGQRAIAGRGLQSLRGCKREQTIRGKHRSDRGVRHRPRHPPSRRLDTALPVRFHAEGGSST